ncbi:hypothetical protein [Ureibacillus acetophenoni]|uniref:Uncharacterized protein n=1 Tax=Ureibacillus acetophenoni TaxID=614649 RepID=A0A285U9U2_9BACL|nr:hypothetical protein [Ureibacillus acetophenoni]SOC37071.1 hypothetical protein SAMN05877842_1032 [Ureibacillus acetophenoni]
MGLKGQMGVSGNIERPRTAKQKKDNEARKKAERKQFEYFIQYRCTKCGRTTEIPMKGVNKLFCVNCHVEGKGLNEVIKMKTKGKRLKTSAYMPKSKKNYGNKKPKFKKKKSTK